MENNIEEALDKLFADKHHLSQIENLVRIPNIFRILGLKDDEVRHSAFLAWLLNPNANHGLGDRFLKTFLCEVRRENDKLIEKNADLSEVPRAIEIEVMDLSDATIITEEYFGASETTGRTDISIINRKEHFYCLVENKIWAGEGEEQTERYAEYAKKNYPDPDYRRMLIFLTPDGRQAKCNLFLPCSYESIVNCLDSVKTHYKVDDSVSSLINQFVYHLKEDIMEESKLIELCRNFYKRHRLAVDEVVKYIPTEKTFYSDIWKKIRQENTQFEKEDWRMHPVTTWMTITRQEWINVWGGRKSYGKVNYGIDSYALREKFRVGLYAMPEIFQEIKKYPLPEAVTLSEEKAGPEIGYASHLDFGREIIISIGEKLYSEKVQQAAESFLILHKHFTPIIDEISQKTQKTIK